MYTTCIIWLAFIIVVVANPNNVSLKVSNIVLSSVYVDSNKKEFVLKNGCNCSLFVFVTKSLQFIMI